MTARSQDSPSDGHESHDQELSIGNNMPSPPKAYIHYNQFCALLFSAWLTCLRFVSAPIFSFSYSNVISSYSAKATDLMCPRYPACPIPLELKSLVLFGGSI